MPSEWRLVALDTVADFFSGATPSKARSDYWNGSIPWVSAKDMKERRLRDAEDHITLAGLVNGSRTAQAGATLILVRGMTLLTDVPICAAEREVAFNQDIKAIVPRDKVDASYLTYSLLAAKPLLLSMVELAGHGTGRLPTDLLRALKVPLPAKSEQRAIANILGTLDDKIELNRWMNETLEAMARAIFKSWFVDFDPVRAKAEGRQPFGMDAETAALFPDSFEDSPLGKIPKGWRVGKFGELVSLGREAVNPGDSPEETFDHYSIPAFDEGRWPKEETGDRIKSNKFLVPEGAILLSKLNPRIPRVWLPSLSARRSIASTEFLVASPRQEFSRAYVFAYFNSQAFLDMFAARVTGTSGSHQRVNPESLLAMVALIPSRESVEGLTRLVDPLYQKAARNLAESRTLANIRDALLPKLISGEIRVSNGPS